MILFILVTLSIFSSVAFCSYTWQIAGAKEYIKESNKEYLALSCVGACSIFMTIYVSAHSHETVSIIVCASVISCLSIMSRLFHKELRSVNIQVKSMIKSTNLA